MINKDNNEKENIDKLAEDVVSALREAEQDTSATPDEVVEVTAAPDEEGATPASGGEGAEQDAFSASDKAVADTKVVPDDEAGQNAAATPRVIVKDVAAAPDNNKEEIAAMPERDGEDVSATSESDDEDATSAPDYEDAASVQEDSDATEAADGETTGKAKNRRPLVKVLTGILCACLIAAVIVLGYAAYLAVKLGRVDTENIYKNIEMSSYLYDSNGEEIDRLYYTEDRESVAIGEVPDHTKNAFIAIEDKTFYKHHGLNLVRMFGAVLQKLTGHADEISGTSTITQQLARNAFLPESKSQRTLKRKFKEIVYALKIEADLSKDEILDAYLNTIYLGYGC